MIREGAPVILRFFARKSLFHISPSSRLGSVNPALALGLVMLGMALGALLTAIVFKGHLERERHSGERH
jgi:hypothetical protein